MNSANAGCASSDTARKILLDGALKVYLLERNTLSVFVLFICGHCIIENISAEAVKVRREEDCSSSIGYKPSIM